MFRNFTANNRSLIEAIEIINGQKPKARNIDDVADTMNKEINKLEAVKDSSKNNGGDTDYYKIKPEWRMLQDIIEDREMNYAQANVLKSAFTFNVGRHNATDYERELNKIIWFANRELERLKK